MYNSIKRFGKQKPCLQTMVQNEKKTLHKLKPKANKPAHKVERTETKLKASSPSKKVLVIVPDKSQVSNGKKPKTDAQIYKELKEAGRPCLLKKGDKVQLSSYGLKHASGINGRLRDSEFLNVLDITPIHNSAVANWPVNVETSFHEIIGTFPMYFFKFMTKRKSGRLSSKIESKSDDPKKCIFQPYDKVKVSETDTTVELRTQILNSKFFTVVEGSYPHYYGNGEFAYWIIKIKGTVSDTVFDFRMDKLQMIAKHNDFEHYAFRMDRSKND